MKYLTPIVGILFCPITILLIFSIWSAPVFESDFELVNEVQP